MTTPIPFWSNDPTIIMNKDYIFEVWPTPKMTFEQKLNAISRLIIILTVLGFIFTMSTKILLVGIITLVVIFALYKSRKQKVTKEMFQNLITENNNPGGALSAINKGIASMGSGEKILR
jgi:ABC-type bacteriocin/lantibiotic exporter with double-glycine peptidase domain